MTTTTSRQPYSATNIKPQTPDEWVEYWVEKTSEQLAETIPFSEATTFLPIIKSLLAGYCRHPATLPLARITACMGRFDTNTSGNGRMVLAFFFNSVIRTVNPQYQSNLSEIRALLAKKNIPPTVANSPFQKSAPHASQIAPSHPEADCAIFSLNQQLSWEEQQKTMITALTNELDLRNYSQRTLKVYTSVVATFLRHLGKIPSWNDYENIKTYILQLKESHAPRTINLTSAAIRFFYQHVVKTDRSVTGLPRMKSGKDLPAVYSMQDIERILNVTANEKHRLLLLVAYGLGIRLSEVRFLTPADVDWERGVILIHGKGSKERQLPIDSVIKIALEQYLNTHPENRYIFEGETAGQPYPERTIEKIYENACTKAGIVRKGGIHSLRHSFATHHLEQGTGIRQIQELLGHSSVKTTQIYTHVSSAELVKIRSPLMSLNLKSTTQPKAY